MEYNEGNYDKYAKSDILANMGNNKEEDIELNSDFFEKILEKAEELEKYNKISNKETNKIQKAAMVNKYNLIYLNMKMNNLIKENENEDLIIPDISQFEEKLMDVPSQIENKKQDIPPEVPEIDIEDDDVHNNVVQKNNYLDNPLIDVQEKNYNDNPLIDVQADNIDNNIPIDVQESNYVDNNIPIDVQENNYVDNHHSIEVQENNSVNSNNSDNLLNINPDFMTYEQLLKLEQIVGDVKKEVSIYEIECNNYNYKKEENEVDINCTICSQDFADNESVTRLPCMHLFHSNCLQQWINSKKMCPICQTEVKYL